jgi:hypothetical protein
MLEVAGREFRRGLSVCLPMSQGHKRTLRFEFVMSAFPESGRYSRFCEFAR